MIDDQQTSGSTKKSAIADRNRHLFVLADEKVNA
jgi:hypothetical protein